MMNPGGFGQQMMGDPYNMPQFGLYYGYQQPFMMGNMMGQDMSYPGYYMQNWQ